MKFYEKKLDAGYEYTVEDVFGTIIITSTAQLKGDTLDAIVSGILHANTTVGNITDTISFVWNRKPLWEPEDEKPTAFQEEITALTVSKKSRSAAFLFALFLGGFGAHRFYSGKGGTAIVQLLLTLTFFGALISGPWALIDCIMIAAGSFRDADGKRISVW